MLNDSKTRPDFHYATADIPVSKKPTCCWVNIGRYGKNLRNWGECQEFAFLGRYDSCTLWLSSASVQLKVHFPQNSDLLSGEHSELLKELEYLSNSQFTDFKILIKGHWIGIYICKGLFYIWIVLTYTRHTLFNIGNTIVLRTSFVVIDSFKLLGFVSWVFVLTEDKHQQSGRKKGKRMNDEQAFGISY